MSVIFVITRKSTNKINSSILIILKLITVYILFLTITSFYISTNVSESLWEIFYLTGWIAIYVFFLLYLNDKCFKYIIISTAIVGSLLSLLVYNDILNILSLSIPSSGKLSATFGYKNFFAQYLCFVIPASICSIYLVKHQKLKFLMVMLSIVSSGALIITRCRAAWLGILIMIILYIIINHKIIKHDIKNIIQYKISILFIFLSIVFLSFIIFRPIDISTGIWIGDKSSFKETLLSVKDVKEKSIWGDRIDMYQASFQMIKDNPIVGVGLGNWKVMYPKYSNNNSYTDYSRHKVILRPHNDLLWIITEMGLVGFIFLVLFSGYHIKLLIKKLRNKNDKDYYLNLFCALSLSAIFIESLFDFPKERVIPNLYIWLILGYIASSNIAYNKKINVVPISLILIFSTIGFFNFLDIKSHLYSQQIQQFKNNNQYKKMEMSSVVSMYYMRNIDHVATPISYYLGIAHYNMGNKDLANEFFSKALDISPYHIGTLNNIMLMYIEKGQFEYGHQTLLTIESIYPKLHKARLIMIKYCIKANKLDFAKDLLAGFDLNLTDPVKKEVNQLQNQLYQ